MDVHELLKNALKRNPKLTVGEFWSMMEHIKSKNQLNKDEFSEGISEGSGRLE